MLERTPSMLVFGSVLLIGAGCAAAPEPQSPASADMPPAGADGEYDVELPQPGRGDARYLGLRIDPTVECNLDEAPKFPFDKARMLPQHLESISNLAACLRSDDLAGARVYVVGHADPRGTDRYNRDLGRRRAEFVKELLVEQGMNADRIVVLSEGEQEAKGQSEEYSYGYDRRVEVHVADVDYGPGPDHEAEVKPVGGR